MKKCINMKFNRKKLAEVTIGVIILISLFLLIESLDIISFQNKLILEFLVFVIILFQHNIILAIKRIEKKLIKIEK